MSVNIKRNGTLQKIADQTLIFDANVSEVRTGTLSTTTTTIPSQDYITLNITFSTPMPDNNYCVVFQDNEIAFETYTVTGKTKNGFNVIVGNTRNIEQRYNFTYYAFKLIELEGYTALYNKVNNAVDSSPTQNSTNFVTSGGVYEAIKNASSVFIGTSSEWESESAKTDYQVAILTDKLNVNAVDSTDGSTTVVANKHLVFKGTLEEWEALTTAEKKTYDEALITNDMDTGEVVNGVTDGDMRAVTSNAVYDAINNVKFGTCTKPSNISATIYDCRYVQFGKVVIVYIFISFTSSIAASTDYIVGLPKAAANATTQLSMTGSTSATDSLRAYIEVNGTSIRNQDRAMNTTETYSGQLIYICQ